jgi:simple sugar transport system permease protein
MKEKYIYQISIFVILFVILSLFIILVPEVFLQSRIYISYLSIIPFTMLLALALTPLIIAKEIDLSFPSIMAVSGYVFAQSYISFENSFLSLCLCLTFGFFAGLLNGLIVVKVGVPSIIATIGSQFLFRGLAMILSGGTALSIIEVKTSFISEVFTGRWFGFLPAQSVWVMGFAVLLWAILFRHKFGNGVLFIGDNIKAAKMMGVNTDKTRILLFIQMGVISSFCAVLLTLEMANWWPTNGEGYLLLVFASIFIGGTSVFGGSGTIFGTFIGAIIIGIIESGIIALGLDGFYTRFVYGVIILVAVCVHAKMLKKY